MKFTQSRPFKAMEYGMVFILLATVIMTIVYFIQYGQGTLWD